MNTPELGAYVHCSHGLVRACEGRTPQSLVVGLPPWPRVLVLYVRKRTPWRSCVGLCPRVAQKPSVGPFSSLPLEQSAALCLSLLLPRWDLIPRPSPFAIGTSDKLRSRNFSRSPCQALHPGSRHSPRSRGNVRRDRIRFVPKTVVGALRGL